MLTGIAAHFLNIYHANQLANTKGNTSPMGNFVRKHTEIYVSTQKVFMLTNTASTIAWSIFYFYIRNYFYYKAPKVVANLVFSVPPFEKTLIPFTWTWVVVCYIALLVRDSQQRKIDICIEETNRLTKEDYENPP